ncbi:MAG: xanthine dehydrogenase family protein molybdopterin-binding subunit [Lewinellaceae bacterium]|nr:xanthine dehydrogenase family protein molybdopterin-binding subunit [Lewinellaceae bacterium]
MANPNNKKALETQKLKLPFGIPGHNLTEIEREAAADEPPALPINEKLSVVGQRVKRVDALQKVTGAAKYTADIQLPGMLYGWFLHSPYPHARIKSLDVSAARKYPGVFGVIVQGHEAEQKDSFGGNELPLLRYAGQPVAAVAAESVAIAKEAVRLIRAEYEPMPFVVQLDEARKPGAPLVYEETIEDKGNAGDVGVKAADEQKGNLRGPTTRSFAGGPRGDMEKGFAEADVIVEQEYRTQVQTHCCLETHGLLADWKQDMLTVYASTQSTKDVRDELAELFALPTSKVRVITEFMGGGFGSKFGPGYMGVAATWLSKLSGRPVKLMLGREAEQISAGNRPNSHQFLKVGAKKDGTLTAVSLLSYGTAGIGLGAGVGRVAQDMYVCPNFKMEQYDVFTHAGPGAAFRAPGNVQGAFAMESLIDELAEKLDMDPLALRDKIDASEIRGVQRKQGAEKFGWKRKKAGSDPGPVKRGIGVAQATWPRFVEMDSSVMVRINKGGSVEVMSGVQDIGTGTKTILAQVVAEELGLKAEDITVKIGDTTYPDALGSGGSMTAEAITPAGRNAAYQARLKFASHLAAAWGVDAETIEMKNGEVLSSSDASKKMTFAEATKHMPTSQVLATASRSANYNGFESGQWLGHGRLGAVQFAEVSVDTETGFVKVERVVAAHSCGRPINPMQVESQINGGVIMGVGYALYEDRIMDLNTGHHINTGLDTYKLPHAREIPQIETHIIEHYDAHSSTDASGIGEPANIATAAAIANAVYNAIGVRIYELPITPQKVLAALGSI